MLSASLNILYENGAPMTTRELTGATAKRLGCSLKYADVSGVMHRHLEDGYVTYEPADDFREDIWSAT